MFSGHSSPGVAGGETRSGEVTMMKSAQDGQRGLPPERQGLYDPRFEHDACGVGMVCHLKGIKSHDIVRQALQILVNLSHRGACGCDETTGDGAGILFQLPDKFLRKVAADLRITLPEETAYASGLVFLPRDPAERAYCMDLFERVIREEGQQFLGWRNVAQHNEVLGDLARAVEPDIHQIFIGRGKGIKDQAHFERKLYVLRKVMEKAIRESGLKEKKFFYVPSLSSRTIVYKGLMLADQIEPFLPDLTDPDLQSAMALVHQRYSTNTFPTWDLAHPFRYLCHNGEINTLRGNVNWITARQRLFHSPLFGDDLRKLFPIATPGASDSAILDNVVELLYHAGRSLPHAMSMLIPEAWQNHETMSAEKKAFYQYHACLAEPWDGPASIPFSDGTCVGAVLDRNGLRPSRYTVTKDGLVIMGSETGVLEVDPANVAQKGRLQPGRMFLVDMAQGRIVDDEEIKHEMAARRPYGAWLKKHLVTMDHLSPPRLPPPALSDDLQVLQNLFGYTLEDLRIVMAPMARTGIEATGSMGVDTPLAVLSDRPQLLYSYFKQLFAQVTNPPLDAIREELVTSMGTSIGAARNLLDETPEHCHQLKLSQPVLTNEELERIREIEDVGISSITLPAVFDPAGGGAALEAAMEGLCHAAESAILGGHEIIILSDRAAGRERAPIPALLACSGVHHHLIRTGLRQRCGLVIESGEPREVHHFATLFGYGASAVNPYLAFETLHQMAEQKTLELDYATAKKNFIKALNKGVLKVMSKMGISTLQSYKGAQQFEAVGLSSLVVDRYFTWTASRVEGADLNAIAREVALRHQRAYPATDIPENLELDVGGLYQWRRTGERHLLSPLVIAKLQEATREDRQAAYDQYAQLVNDQTRDLLTLRGLLQFKPRGAPRFRWTRSSRGPRS
jgi:glutamate synthase domain-containing protein 1